MIRWFSGGGWVLLAMLAVIGVLIVGGYWLCGVLGIPVVATVH